MKKGFLYIIEALLLIVIVYFKYFNHYFDTYLSKSNILNSIISYIIFFIAIHFIAKFLKYLYSKSNKLPIHYKNNIHFGIENIAKLLLGIGLIVTFSSFFGLAFKELITSMSIVAAAFAILSKEYILDLISGIYLSFSKDFEINDYVKLENHKGNIVEIGMLKLKILNENDDVVIIPNGKVHSNEIINYTKRDIRRLSIDFQIDIKLIKDIEKLEEELISSLQPLSDYIEKDSYNLKIVQIKKDHLDLKFQYRLEEFNTKLQKQIRKKTVRKVFNFVTSKHANIN